MCWAFAAVLRTLALLMHCSRRINRRGMGIRERQPDRRRNLLAESDLEIDN
jgi:hypothetical protein